LVKRNRHRPLIRVIADGRDIISHAGSRLLGDLSDRLGLTDGLSEAMASTKCRRRGHDRGEVLVDLAVMVASGGEAISDLAVLRNQPRLFGEVASNPTAWRTLEAIDEDTLDRIASARAAARATAWEHGADPGFYVIDIDATLVTSHSDKQGAAPNYKQGYGFHPLVAYLDATGEALAGLLRPGNAAPNTVRDHLVVLDQALDQLPLDPKDHEVIVRADSAGLTHGFLEHCREREARFLVGHDLTRSVATVLVSMPEERWIPALSPDGAEEREGAEVAEVSDLLDLSSWPEGTRAIARREEPHAGAQLSFTDVDGHRFQVCVTDLKDPDVAYLEALYRGRGRAERRICDGKDTGMGKFPSESFSINSSWLVVSLIAQDLLAWTRLLCLDGELSRAEPKRLRYCLLHAAGTVARSGRCTRLRLAATWPWANELVTAFGRLRAIPLRC